MSVKLLIPISMLCVVAWAWLFCIYFVFNFPFWSVDILYELWWPTKISVLVSIVFIILVIIIFPLLFMYRTSEFQKIKFMAEKIWQIGVVVVFMSVIGFLCAIYAINKGVSDVGMPVAFNFLIPGISAASLCLALGLSSLFLSSAAIFILKKV